MSGGQKGQTRSHIIILQFLRNVILQNVMLQCYINVKDMQLAYRIDAILNTGTNIQLLGDGYKEGLY